MRNRIVLIAVALLTFSLHATGAEDNRSIYIFPFHSNFGDYIVEFTEPQAAYVSSYPKFLYIALLSNKGLRVFDRTGLVAKSNKADGVGVCNWTTDELIGTIQGEGNRNGFGVTGYLEINENGLSHIQLRVFDLGTGKDIYTKKYYPNEQTLLYVLTQEVIADILRGTRNEERLVKHDMLLPESMVRTSRGFLIYLRFTNEINFQRYLSSTSDRKRQLALAYEGFQYQSDYLVLQMLYTQLLSSIKDRRPYLREIQAIDAAMTGKTKEYIEAYNQGR